MYFDIRFVTIMITIWSGASRSTTLRARGEIFRLYPPEEDKHPANNMPEGHHDLRMPYTLSTVEVLQHVSVLFPKGLYGIHHAIGTLYVVKPCCRVETRDQSGRP